MTNLKSEDKLEKTKTNSQDAVLTSTENDDLELSDENLTNIVGGDGENGNGGGGRGKGGGG